MALSLRFFVGHAILPSSELRLVWTDVFSLTIIGFLINGQ